MSESERTMEHSRLSEIRARLAAITPGEWEAGRPDMATIVDGVDSKWIYARKDLRSQYVAVASGRIDGPWSEVVANAQFIGHAPADIAWLLDALDDEHMVAEDRLAASQSSGGATSEEDAAILAEAAEVLEREARSEPMLTVASREEMVAAIRRASRRLGVSGSATAESEGASLRDAAPLGMFEFEVLERLVATIDPADYRSRDISTHWEDCWRAHTRCAQEMVVRLTRTVRELRDALDAEQLRANEVQRATQDVHSRGSAPSEEAVKVDQRPHGCTLACVATLTGIPLDELPHPPADASDDWFEIAENRNAISRPMHEALARHGWFMVHLWKKVPVGFAIAGGTSPRGIAHSVVVRDGVLWHDPHPSRAGLVGEIEGYDILVRLIPSTQTAGFGDTQKASER